METLLSEHGQIIQYAVIGIIIITVFNVFCMSKINEIKPFYNNSVSKTNSDYESNKKDRRPVIEANDVFYVGLGDSEFDIRKMIRATDCNGKDLSGLIKIYGKVDVNTKGAYNVRCVVVSDENLVEKKNIDIIVE